MTEPCRHCHPELHRQHCDENGCFDTAVRLAVGDWTPAGGGLEVRLEPQR